MSDTITKEIQFFLHAALSGVLLSAVYDVLRILRRIYPHGSVWVAIEDFFYWIAGALYISYVIMKENNGIIRWFFVLGILLGMLIYNFTAGRYLVPVISKIINKILHVVGKVLKIVLKPVAFLWKKTKKAGGKGGKFCEKYSIKLKKRLHNCCKTIKIGIKKK